MYEPYCTAYFSSYNSDYEKQYETFNSNQPITTSIETKTKSIRRSKHIPHHLRPHHIVEKRNTRERRRVHDVNQAFLLLKALLPFDAYNNSRDQLNSTRISKVRTLRQAVNYIEALQHMLNETN
ncbi:unnamed protein product [Adineta steineri]|uniref:BHLH domain-containing protein n=1 Tax=Adineta steineri TaxID=433720 RepID=A0A818TQZ1_9BILA|nr:unnamed protein product [Adineta steineri]CAF0955836.1 unnamed protein product [Adineta steineri]CAF3688353.1 unnamed protein product [Adineta steineri]CAF3902627.1 unnamed protein product [Adineta steineri]